MNMPANPRPYVRVPDRLLRAYAYDPLTVGVYVAVARCAFSARSSIPLSPADLAEWSLGRRVRDPGIFRRIQKLIVDRWLIAKRGSAVKLHLLPAWEAPSTETIVPWQFSQSQAGKPGHVRTQRVPLDLLDVYVGRIDPQPGRRPALVTRYLDRPALDFTDVGTFALALIANPVPTKRLISAGLWSDPAYQEVPPVHAALTYLVNSGQHSLSALGNTILNQADSEQASENHSQSNSAANGSLKRALNGSHNGSVHLRNEIARIRASEPPSMRSCKGGKTAAWDSWDSGKRRIPSPIPDETPGTDRHGGGIESSLISQHEHPYEQRRLRRELLETIGIRHTDPLADCPLAIIQAWHTALQNAAFASRFSDPAAYAYTQLRAGQMPSEKPGHVHVPRSMRPEHYQPVREPAFADHEALVARARALSGSTDELLLCYVIEALNSGLSDTEAYEAAHERLKQDGHHSGEEVSYVSRTGQS